MNPEQAVKVYKYFLEAILKNEDWYKKIIPSVKATLLYGSVAKGTNRKDSDIDILLILPLKLEEKYTKGEYFYKYKNNEINIVIRSIEKLRLIAKEKNDKYQKEVFRNSIIISEMDDEIRNLLLEIEKI